MNCFMKRILFQRRSRHKLLLLGITCAAFLSAFDNLEAQILADSRYESLVTNDDTTPDGAETYTFFSSVIMSKDGSWIGFEGDYTGSVGRGLFRYSTANDSVDQIIANGDDLPGGNFSMSFANRQLSINNNGTLAFNGVLSGATTTSDTGLYSGTGGAITEMVREGNDAPGGLGGTFQNFGTGILDAQFRGINELGQATFSDSIADSPGGLSDDQRFFFAGPGATQTAPVAENDAAPNGGIVVSVGASKLNDMGEAIVTGTTSTTNIGNKLWFVDSGGGVSELVTASVSGGTATDKGTIHAMPGSGTLNNNGDVVFSGWTSIAGNGTSDSHVFRTSKAGGAPVAILSEGDAAPDGNGEFANFLTFQPRLNEAGQYASGMDLRNTSGGTTDDSGIYRIDPNGDVVKIFREGDAALTGNGTFGFQTGFRNFAFNEAGNIAMETIYSGTSGGSSDNVAIVISDGIDSFEVAREGNVIDGRTVLGLDFENSVYGVDRTTSGLNDYGQVAYQQTLSGGVRSIELWTPELHHRGGDSDFGDSSRWTLSLGPAHVHDVFLDSATDSVVTANGTHTVRSLQIGGGTGMATLALADNAELNVIHDINLASNGSIQMGANSNLDVFALTGSGMIAGDVSSSILVEDLLSPGASPGQLEFAGNLALESSATTLIELGGLLEGEFDQVIGLNSLDLDGDLVVELYDGFELAEGMQFEIFDVVGTTTGQFNGLANGDLVGTFGGTELFISYSGSAGGGVTLSTFSAVPEPNALIFVGLAMGVAILRRNRA